MNRKIKNKMNINLYCRRLLFLGLMLFAVQMLQAQSPDNLIKNPSFEELRDNNKKAENWSFEISSATKATNINPHEGQWCMMFYAYSGSISNYVLNPKIGKNVWEYVKVEEGQSYRLSYWLRADKVQNNVYPSIAWRTDLGAKVSNPMEDKIAHLSTEWKQEVVEFTVPAGAEYLGISFGVKTVPNGGYIYIDDVVLVKTSDGSGQVTLSTPQDLVIEKHQRELEVQWNKGLVEGMSWDIRLNGGDLIKVDKPFYTFTDLEPNTQYQVEVRCHKGNNYSEFTTPKSVTTTDYSYGRDDLERIPYIRTIDEFGACSQTIQLYFVNLYNKNAKITYLFDGEELKPQGKTLTFPKTGRHCLEVIIEEDETHSWHLDYKLIIQ